MLVLETSAGSGDGIGSSVEDLADAMEFGRRPRRRARRLLPRHRSPVGCRLLHRRRRRRGAAGGAYRYAAGPPARGHGPSQRLALGLRLAGGPPRAHRRRQHRSPRACAPSSSIHGWPRCPHTSRRRAWTTATTRSISSASRCCCAGEQLADAYQLRPSPPVPVGACEDVRLTTSAERTAGCRRTAYVRTASNRTRAALIRCTGRSRIERTKGLYLSHQARNQMMPASHAE